MSFIAYYSLYLLHNRIGIMTKMPQKELNKIKEVLDNKGISQTWLANQLGKSFSMVNAYVCNRRQPTLENLYQIAEILQVSVKDLLIDKRKNE